MNEVDEDETREISRGFAKIKSHRGKLMSGGTSRGHAGRRRCAAQRDAERWKLFYKASP